MIWTNYHTSLFLWSTAIRILVSSSWILINTNDGKDDVWSTLVWFVSVIIFHMTSYNEKKRVSNSHSMRIVLILLQGRSQGCLDTSLSGKSLRESTGLNNYSQGQRFFPLASTRLRKFLAKPLSYWYLEMNIMQEHLFYIFCYCQIDKSIAKEKFLVTSQLSPWW